MPPAHPGNDQPTDQRYAAPAAGELVAALLDPLLDGRAQPAAEQFDRLVASALADGRISAELARELRFWQRAAVHELSDHVRTVLPAVLPVAMSALTSAAADASASASAAAQAWSARDTPATGASEPAGAILTGYPDAEPVAEVVVSAADEIALNTEPPGDETETAPVATNPHLRRRLFVAGLTSTA